MLTDKGTKNCYGGQFTVSIKILNMHILSISTSRNILQKYCGKCTRIFITALRNTVKLEGTQISINKGLAK